MGRNRKLTVEQCTQIRHRYERDEDVRSIASSFKVATLTIMRAVLIAGGTIPEGPTYDAMREKLTRRSGPKRTVESYIMDGYRRVVIDEGELFYEMGVRRGHHNHGTRTVLEHRLVMARKLGRALLAHETVHHKDGDTLNNRIKNLELRVGQHGKGATEAHCSTCTCFAGS